MRAYSWLGQVFEGDPAHPAAASSRGGPWIADRLHSRLYADFYLTGGPAPASGPLAWRLGATRPAATDHLSSANRGTGARQRGWAVQRIEGKSLVVARDGLAAWAKPQCVGARTGAQGPDTEVEILLPKERLGASEGFYTMLGDAGPGGENGVIDRFYWHVRPTGARLLVDAASEVLNREDLPFRLKVVNDPRGFHRCDAGVLYTRRDDRAAALAILGAIRRRVAPEVRDAVPALTLRLGPGLGFAEDPGGGESYGSHRCRLLAHAIVRSFEAGERTTGERLESVARCFREAGLDLERPYLGPDAGNGAALTGVSA